MTDFYAPALLCCSAVFVWSAEVNEWRHSAVCHVAAGLAVAIPLGHCPLHPSEPDVMTCRGCIETAELRREQEEGIV